MCKRCYLTLLLILLYIFSACAPAAPQIVVLPTLAVLPSATPEPSETASPTLIPSPTVTPQPSATDTPNLVETQIAQLNATNVSSQLTLAMLLTKSAPTNTLDVTLTASETITNTLPPSLTATVTPMPPAVVAMQAQVIYARSTANLRTCAAQTCEKIAQLQAGESVVANGSIEGEAINAGHSSWYRVDYRGQALYVYGQLISFDAPTTVPVYIPPTAAPVSLPPVSVPQSGGHTGGANGATCPDIKASCSQLTCDQAYACLAAGHKNLDRDGDGVPCESVCGG
ncbi:MAG: hypothetical protein GC204_12830 [Chloroflexi bacterium]|nr:hypothetical protein [Chloroflexota bacterium]